MVNRLHDVRGIAVRNLGQAMRQFPMSMAIEVTMFRGEHIWLPTGG